MLVTSVSVQLQGTSSQHPARLSNHHVPPACLLSQTSDVSHPLTTDSFRRFQVSHMAADMKETLCRLSADRFDAERDAHPDSVTYEVRHRHEARGSGMWGLAGGGSSTGHL